MSLCFLLHFQCLEPCLDIRKMLRRHEQSPFLSRALGMRRQMEGFLPFQAELTVQPAMPILPGLSGGGGVPAGDEV